MQGTPGAQFHAGLQIPHAELVLRKGYRRDIDSYSAFYENDHTTPTGLAGYLRERGLTRVFLAGLALDFCVRYSAEDAHRCDFVLVGRGRLPRHRCRRLDGCDTPSLRAAGHSSRGGRGDCLFEAHDRQIIGRETSMTAADEPTLADKVEFLSRPEAYPHCVGELIRTRPTCRGCFSRVTRSTSSRSRFAFPISIPRWGVARRPAGPSSVSTGGLPRMSTSASRRWSSLLAVSRSAVPGRSSIGWSSCAGSMIAWALEQVLREGRLETAQLDRLVTTLVRFYRRARPAFVSPGVSSGRVAQENLTLNRRVLLDARFDLPSGLIRRIDRIQRRFVADCGNLLASRVRRRRIVDGHGDLRPEHVWLDHQVRIIDCLEFNTRLRTVDPLDEIAFLTLECERLGAAWAGQYISKGIERGLHEVCPPSCFYFYRSYRATLRARLAIAHLFEPKPRTPEKWPRLARTYLNIAARDAAKLEALLRTRRGR